MNIAAIQNLHDRVTALGEFSSQNFIERFDTFANEALETTGTYDTAQDKTVIDLHRIRVTGRTDIEAQNLWMRAAQSHLARRAVAEA
ncbi:MAG: hypothetical protein ACSHX3_15880 [Litorimonas sp.]